MKPSVLVTGDLVVDCCLYSAVRTDSSPFGQAGTIYRQHYGGAALTQKLLRESAEHAGKAAWEAAKKAQRPDSLGDLGNGSTSEEPDALFDVHLGLEINPPVPEQLLSYGVWSDHPARRGSAERVWRLDRDYGYGPGRAIPDKGVFAAVTIEREADPALTVIDDGGICFRQENARPVWPALSADTSHFLLKMGPPLCRGDLWPALKPVRDRLIVLVTASDLRRADAQISYRSSWEECAESTLRALQRTPTLRELLDVAHLIVNFGFAGALWIAGAAGEHATRLIFDPILLEEDFERDFDGTAYGFQTCVLVGIAHHLMACHAAAESKRDPRAPSPFRDTGAMERSLEEGIVAGLQTRRRLLELGHGPVPDETGTGPQVPMKDLGEVLATSPGGFITADVSTAHSKQQTWSIVAQEELVDASTTPLIGLAHLTARYGRDALSRVPGLKVGRLFTVDRGEIESLRALDVRIREYERGKVQNKPLCIGVFGPPGSGKSFGVQSLVTGILGDRAPILEFNLSQFNGPEDLIGALHRVRDAVLKGVTPVAFWDEFDSRHSTWLQYLLAPMQDGAFQEGQITHPIGKCVFVFAGGTSATLEEFDIADPRKLPKDEFGKLNPDARKTKEEEYLEFKRRKGPDFVSRLHGFLNVLGVNPGGSADITWPIRRALVLRSILRLDDHEELDIDFGLLYALLGSRIYRHGARSLEKIVVPLISGRDKGRLQRSALLPDPLLDRETEAAEFRSLMEESTLMLPSEDLEDLAAVIHASFIAGAEAAADEAAIADRPERAWKIDPSVRRGYDDLSEDLKASNRAAARRVSEHLLLVNFVIKPQEESDDRSWMGLLERTIEKHIDRLAQAEHLGWSAERRASGWSFAAKRDNARKHHPSLVDWAALTISDREKDRHSVRSIPGWLKRAGLKAVPVSKDLY